MILNTKSPRKCGYGTRNDAAHIDTDIDIRYNLDEVSVHLFSQVTEFPPVYSRWLGCSLPRFRAPVLYPSTCVRLFYPAIPYSLQSRYGYSRCSMSIPCVLDYWTRTLAILLGPRKPRRSVSVPARQLQVSPVPLLMVLLVTPQRIALAIFSPADELGRRSRVFPSRATAWTCVSASLAGEWPSCASSLRCPP